MANLSTGETVLLVTLAFLFVGMSYDILVPQGVKKRSVQGATDPIYGYQFKLGAPYDEMTYARQMDHSAVAHQRLGAAVSPAYANLGVAALDSAYSQAYNPALQKPDVPDTRVPAPTYWDSMGDEARPLSDAYGSSWGAAPQPVSVASAQGVTNPYLEVTQRPVVSDLLRGIP
mgnify:CR=1 FL=1